LDDLFAAIAGNLGFSVFAHHPTQKLHSIRRWRLSTAICRSW